MGVVCSYGLNDIDIKLKLIYLLVFEHFISPLEVERKLTIFPDPAHIL